MPANGIEQLRKDVEVLLRGEPDVAAYSRVLRIQHYPDGLKGEITPELKAEMSRALKRYERDEFWSK